MLNILDIQERTCYLIHGGDGAEEPKSKICPSGKRYLSDGAGEAGGRDETDHRDDRGRGLQPVLKALHSDLQGSGQNTG